VVLSFTDFIFDPARLARSVYGPFVRGFLGVLILCHNFNALRTEANVGGKLGGLFCLCDLSM